MAFCPNCGKSVTEQASKCLACGHDFEPRAKGARFKGTMMMSPVGAPTAPGPTPAKPAAAAPAPAKPAAAPRPTAPGPSKVAKATMLGTGGMGLAPPAAPRASAPQAPPPAAGAAVGTATTERPPAAAPTPAPAPAPAPALRDTPPTDESRAPASGREDSQRFLAGDPMAPEPPAATPTQRGRRFMPGSSDVPGTRQGAVIIAIGVIGMLVIAAVGYAAAKILGVIQ